MVDGAHSCSPDDTGYGFDNIADVLSVSPMLMERYLSAARKIARLAVGDPSMKPGSQIYPGIDVTLAQDDRMSDDLPFGSRGGRGHQALLPGGWRVHYQGQPAADLHRPDSRAA